MSNRMINAFIVISAISSLIANGAAISILIQSNAQRAAASTKASSERATMAKQNDNILCILKIQPEDRTAEAIDNCRKTTVGV